MDELSVRFRSASAEELRFSTTADDPDHLITVESITTKLGTGFDAAVMTLHRDPFERFDDITLLVECIITDSEGFVLHEGHVTGLPPEAGKIKINSTGKFSILKDRSGFSRVYSDKDVSHWGGMPIARRNALALLGFNPQDGNTMGGSVVTQLAHPTWTSPGLPVTESWYTAPPGVNLESITGTWTRSGAGVSTGGTSFQWAAFLCTDDAAASYDWTNDLEASGPATFSRDATVSGRRYAMLQLLYGAAFATDDSVDRAIIWSDVTVQDDHGLTSITASEVIKHMIDTYAPGLTYDDESITDHPYEIGQLVFDGVDGSDVIAKVNSFANWDFNVWEGGKCWYGPQPDLNAPDVILDMDDGDVLDPDGQSISEDYPVNGVEMFYTDVLTDRPERVGPEDDTRLEDTSDENPCNKENRSRYGKMDVSFSCNEDDAIQIGAVWLAEHLIPSRSGSGKAVGDVQSAGEQIPARRIRSGQVVRYRHESIGRQVYETTYQPASGEVTLKYDDGAATLTAMLERIGIALILAGSK
jgi:hypothetical protein